MIPTTASIGLAWALFRAERKAVRADREENRRRQAQERLEQFEWEYRLRALESFRACVADAEKENAAGLGGPLDGPLWESTAALVARIDPSAGSAISAHLEHYRSAGLLGKKDALSKVASQIHADYNSTLSAWYRQEDERHRRCRSQPG